MPTLLIIDVERGFINENTKHIPALVEQKQHEYDTVWAVRLVYGKDSPFLTIRQRSGIENIERPTELAFTPRDDARILEKYGYSAATPELIAALRQEGVTSVDIAGMDTDQCVLATAFGLFDAGMTPRILEHYCASTGGETMHQVAMQLLRRALGEQHIV